MSKTQYIFDNTLSKKVSMFYTKSLFWVFLFTFLLIKNSDSIGQVTIVNEPFNSTNPSGWTVDASSWLLNTSYTSGIAPTTTYCASISSGKANKYIYIPINVTAGNKYDISFYSKRICGTQVYINETADQTSPLYSYTSSPACDNTWPQTFCTQWTSTYSGSVYVEIAYTGSTFGSSTAYLENVQITETVPSCLYPTTNATFGAFTNIGQNSVTVNWSGGNGDKHLVVAKAAASVLTQPSDGGVYTASSIFGSGSQLGTGNYVVYDGTGTSVNVTNLDPATTYNFYVYEYKTTGPCYKVAGVTSSQATAACSNYYINDASLTGDVFTTAIGNNSNDGRKPSAPKLSLSHILSSYTLNSGDTIFIDSGTYTDCGGSSPHCNHDMILTAAGVTFIGTGWDKTIFDHANGGSNTDYFMYLSNTANNSTFKNFQVYRYDNSGSYTPAGHSGQSFTINGATNVLIENVVMNKNGAAGGNPSISVLANSTVTLRNGGSMCNLWQTQYTGGVEAYGNGITLNIENYAFAFNFKTGAYDGGGLLISNANATTTVNVNNTRFYNNESSDGGAISQRGGILNVTDCIIDGNFAGQTSAVIYGGGVRITKGTATFTKTKFTNNAIGSAGGTLYGGAIAAYSNDGVVSLTLDNCYFSGNNGNGDDLYAGKAYGNNVTVQATNTTFSSSSDAINNTDGTVHLSNCGTVNVSGTNSPAVIFDNTNLPSSVPNPSTPSISGNCGSFTLPIELVNFKGICLKNKIELYWKTASEKNNDYFRIEKSLDGRTFTQIGIVNGSGNSNSLKSYSFSDNNIKYTNNYYRLIQVDENGKYSVSDVIFVTNSCNDINFEINSLFYNISAQEINLDVLAGNSGNVTVSVSDILGRIVLNNEQELSEGMNHINIQANLLNGAMYIVSVYNEKTVEHKKIYINKN